MCQLWHKGFNKKCLLFIEKQYYKLKSAYGSLTVPRKRKQWFSLS